MPDLKSQVSQIMLQNRRKHGEFQYTLPSPDSYPYQWLWDSCFHAIILSHFDLESAKKELESLVTRQFDNGMIPHMIYWDKQPFSTFPNIDWGLEDTSTITQPPMLAYAVWQIFQKERNKEFLSQMYPVLKRFYHYFLTDRDPRNHHLAGIINPDESGEDNSPRFDLALKLLPEQSGEINFQKRLDLIAQNKACSFDAPFCMKNFFWAKDVPINVILVANLKIMSDISMELAKESEADYYFEQTKLIEKAMRELMLENGVFWSIYLPPGQENYHKILVKTWAILAPLFAHIYTQEEARYVVERYLHSSSEFATPFLIPSVSQSDPAFDPQGFWRGPVWICVNWFIFKGLKKYGFHADAKKILDSTLSLLEKSGFREQYNPLTGEGLGARNFTWGGLVLDML
jgi:glycogen debranching enzyme